MRRGLQQSPTCSQADGACKLQRGSCIVRGAGHARAHADLPLFKRSSKRCVDHDQDVVDEAAHAASVITGVMNALAIEARPCFVGRLGLQDHACPLSRARCGGSVLSPCAARTPPSPVRGCSWVAAGGPRPQGGQQRRNLPGTQEPERRLKEQTSEAVPPKIFGGPRAPPCRSCGC